MPIAEPESRPVIRRRRWTREQKRRIVEESEQEGVNVVEVAQRHGLSASMLYRWRSALGVGGNHNAGNLQSRVASLESQMQRQSEQMQALLSTLVAAQLGCR